MFKPDYTLICIDEECECVLWKDESNGGLLYRTFDNFDFIDTANFELGLTYRVKGLIEEMVLLDEQKEGKITCPFS